MIRLLSRFAVIAAAVVLGVTLVSGLATINFNHKHKLPKMTSEAYSCTGAVMRSCSIHFTSTVKKPDHYQALLVFIHGLKSGDQVKVYLNGNGGLVSSTLQLINAIQHSPAHFTMIVEAPVHSAHAFLAVAGDKLVMRPMTYLMFHRSSAYGKAEKICARQSGKDRTISKKVKCLQYYKAIMTIDREFIHKMLSPIMSPDDVARILKGEDIYLFPVKAKVAEK